MLYILLISGAGSGTGSGQVLRISSPTPNPNLAIGENPTPTPILVNSDFPCQNRGGSETGPTGSGPVAMPTLMEDSYHSLSIRSKYLH